MIKAIPVASLCNTQVEKPNLNVQETYLRVNKNCLYKSTKRDRELILHHIQKKINRQKKTLIYYTVFGEDYKQIFDYSLKSIRHFTDNIDIIAITDQPDLDCDIILKEPVDDFIEASMMKLDIFEELGNNIFNYDNVLFLDCDVLAIKPLDFLQKPLDDKLQVVRSRMYDTEPRPWDFKSNYYHGLKIELTDEQRESIIQNKYSPFNAGHFLFKPTNEMREHFRNVRWLTRSWPGEYFYEQGFMNYYFCVLNSLVSYSILNDEVEFKNLNTNTNPPFNTPLIHFIGQQITPIIKLENIRDAYSKYI